jgi:hypothetical protein
LALVEDLQALLVQALLERELVFEFFGFVQVDVGGSNTVPLYSARRIESSGRAAALGAAPLIEA